MEERRLHTRHEAQLDVWELHAGGTTRCRSTNLSAGGLYLRRLEGGVLLEGEWVWLEIDLPGDPRPIRVRATVVKQVEETLYDSAAVSFVGLPSLDTYRLRRFLNERPEC